MLHEAYHVLDPGWDEPRNESPWKPGNKGTDFGRRIIGGYLKGTKGYLQFQQYYSKGYPQ
jgi:hypothetical protein